MSWLFSQVLVEEYSEANCLDGKPSVQLSVMPTPAKFWRNDKTMEFSNLSQFGLTSKLLTEQDGEELLTSYLEAFRAKTLAQQEKAQESKVSEAECGKKWHGLLAKLDLNTLLWKTAQCSLLEDLEQSLEIWPRWGLMRNGECYLRPMLVQTINEKESGLLPDNETFFHTPNTTGLDGGSNSRKALKKRLKEWPTPDANMGARGTQPDWQPIRKSGQPAQYTINQAVRDSFPTPQASDNRDRGNLSSPCVQRRAEIGKQISLSQSVSESSGKLNPTWVEWLMGWPLAWTDLKPLEMDKCLYVQPQHLNCLEVDLIEVEKNE
jgi:hypothetical protein